MRICFPHLSVHKCFGAGQPGIQTGEFVHERAFPVQSFHRQRKEQVFPIPEGAVQRHGDIPHCLALADDGAKLFKEGLRSFRRLDILADAPEPVRELPCHNGHAAGGEHHHRGNKGD